MRCLASVYDTKNPSAPPLMMQPTLQPIAVTVLLLGHLSGKWKMMEVMQRMSHQRPVEVGCRARPENAMLVEVFVVQRANPKPELTELTGRHLAHRQRLAHPESADHP